MEKKEKPIRMVTPIGEAKWAHIHTPKPPFEGKGNPKYQIDVVFSGDDEEWKAWATDLAAKVKALPQQVNKKTGEVYSKQQPIKRELDDNDIATGRFYVTFKTSDKFKPGIFDKSGHIIPPEILIGNGSLVQVAYTENVYDAFGGGINLYLNAVKVVELVEYQNKTAQGYGFDVEDAPVSAFDIAGVKKDAEDVPF